MDLTIPLIVGSLFVGLKLSQKQSREKEKEVILEQPVGNNIYASRDALKNQKELQKKADERFEKSKNTFISGIVPELFNTSCQVDCGEITDPVAITGKTLLPSIGSGKLTDKQAQILGGPMFRGSGISGLPQDAANTTIFNPKSSGSAKEGFSDLAGTPVTTSMNFQPFFGSSVKQNTNIENPAIDILGLYSGASELYQRKQEAKPFFAPEQQNIFGSHFIPDQSRYIQTNLKTNLLPATQTKESPINAHNLRVTPKSGEELYVNPKQSYEGRTVDGLKGATRGIFSEFQKNTPETFFEKGAERHIVATGQTVQRTREVFENGKEGLSEQPLPLGQIYSVDQLKNSTRLSKEASSVLGELESLVQQDRRTTDSRFVLGNAKNSDHSIDYADIDKYLVREQERDTTNLTYLGAPRPNQTKPVTFSNEGARETCKIQVENHLVNPGRGNAQQSREQYLNCNQNSGKEQLEDLHNYILSFEEKTKVNLGADNISCVRLKSDENRRTKFDGQIVNRITETVTRSQDLGEKIYKNDYKQDNRLEDLALASLVQSKGNETFIKRF
jgi:hypothetical protein